MKSKGATKLLPETGVKFEENAVRTPGDGNNLTADEDTVFALMNTTSSTATVNVPAEEEEAGRIIFVVDVGGNAAGQNITFSPNGNVDGSGTATISTDNGQLRAICDGTNWFTF